MAAIATLLPAICDKLHVSAAFQELEIAYEVELVGAKLQACQTNHVRKVAVAVAPVERFGDSVIPCAERVTFAVIRGKIIQCDTSKAFAFYSDTRRLGQLRIGIGMRLDR